MNLNSVNWKHSRIDSRSAAERLLRIGTVRSVSFSMLSSSTACNGPSRLVKSSRRRATTETRVRARTSAARGSSFSNARSPKYSPVPKTLTSLSSFEFGTLTKHSTVPSLTRKNWSPVSPCLRIDSPGSYVYSMNFSSTWSRSPSVRWESSGTERRIRRVGSVSISCCSGPSTSVKTERVSLARTQSSTQSTWTARGSSLSSARSPKYSPPLSVISTAGDDSDLHSTCPCRMT